MENKQEQEIERKWILKTIPIFKLDEFTIQEYEEVIDIEQHYVKIDDKQCRIRISQKSFPDSFSETTKYEVIHKEKIGHGHNIEHHYDISRSEVETMLLSNHYPYIRKQRWVKYFDGYKIEVDVFRDMTLIMMEVEVPYIEFPIVFPSEVQKEIIMEVTGMKEFDNYSLSYKEL